MVGKHLIFPCMVSLLSNQKLSDLVLSSVARVVKLKLYYVREKIDGHS